MSKLQKALFLSDKGYADLKKAIFACTLTNLAMLLPFCVTVMIFSEILSPFVSGGTIQWNHIWMLWGAGIISAILVFLAAKNDYRKTYIASYKESNTTRLRIAEHLRKLPMNFFNTKDLSELTTNMMADCSSMESSAQQHDPSTDRKRNYRNPDLYPACLFRLAARTVCIYHGSDCVPYYLAQPEPSKEIVRKTG